VRLLPLKEDEQLRKGRPAGTWSILGKLTLNLPCFGFWMPRAYWVLFSTDSGRGPSCRPSRRKAIRRGPPRQHRSELDGAGIEREVDAIVADLLRDGLAKPGR